MSSTETTAIAATVEIPTPVLLEAAAALYALDDYLGDLVGEPVAEWCRNHAAELEHVAFFELEEATISAAVARGQHEDDAMHTFAPSVELYARTAELTADLHQLDGEAAAAAKCRREARAMRRLGSWDPATVKAAEREETCDAS